MAHDYRRLNVKGVSLGVADACEGGFDALTKLVVACPQPTAEVALWWPGIPNSLGSNIAATTENRTRPERLETGIGEVHVHEVIGEGSRSEVVRGVLECDRRCVAVKLRRSGLRFASPSKMAALKQDVESIAKELSHPHVVGCLGVNLDQTTVNLVFEFMGGRTLEDYYMEINDSDELVGSTVPFSQTLSWTTQLFEGLRFLHERPTPIVLRDLKPSNLLLSADLHTLKIRNFVLDNATDLAVRACSSAAHFSSEARVDIAQLSRPTNKWFSGTARYMAPEIESSGSRWSSYTSAADIYSAALVVYLMLEGRRPWEEMHGHRAHNTLARAGFSPKLDHAQHPEGAGELLEYCWAHEPEERPAAAQVLECLDVLRGLHCEALAPKPQPASEPVSSAFAADSLLQKAMSVDAIG